MFRSQVKIMCSWGENQEALNSGYFWGRKYQRTKYFLPPNFFVKPPCSFLKKGLPIFIVAKSGQDLGIKP